MESKAQLFPRGVALPYLVRFWPRHAPVVIFAAACLVYGLGLGRLGLISRDEPRYCTVAWAMLASGDFVTPRFNGAVYLDKPPLLHWMTAASFALLGRNEFAARLPTMLTAALCTALVSIMTRHVFGHLEGLLAAAVLGSSLVWFGMARYVRFDTPLALSVSAAIWWAWLGSEKGRDGRHYYVLASIAAALGILMKGPIALVLAGGSFLIYLAAVRRLRALKEVPWIPVVAVMALITLPWFAACERANPGATAFFLGHENLWRITRRVATPQQQPWWHVLAFLIGGVMPWSVCVPGALGQGLREARGADSPGKRMCILLLLWIGLTVAVYIPPPVKFFQYVIPAMPALAILIAHHTASTSVSARLSLFGLGLFLGSAGLCVLLLAPRLLSLCGLSSSPLVPVATALGVFGGAIVLLGTLTRRQALAVGGAVPWVPVIVLTAWYAAQHCYPHYVSDKVPVLSAARYARHSETLVCYGYTPCAAVFYYPYRIITVGYPVPEYDYPGNAGRLGHLYYPYEQAKAVFGKPPAMIGLVRSKEWNDLCTRVPEYVRFLERCEPYVIFRTVPRR